MVLPNVGKESRKEGGGVIIPVILSGGTGTRLWPLSRESRPKQFLALTDEFTLFQHTLQRLVQHPQVAAPIVVCNEEHRYIVGEQLQALDVRPAAILLEPFGRNTAPAIGLAALQASSGGDDPLLLVLPADHIIERETDFLAAIDQAVAAARDGMLVTFGIQPIRPETGYGYIKGGAGVLGLEVRTVERFVEKPSLETAHRFLEEGSYYWNSGMFLFRASVYLNELAKHAPAIEVGVRRAYERGDYSADFIRPDSESFLQCPDDSIDYAVMEKTAKAAVLPIDVGWNDVGSWLALWEIGEKDRSGNVISGEVICVDTTNSYVRSDRLVTLVGLDNVVVIETADALLVANKDEVQNVRKVVNELRTIEHPAAVRHRKVYRPWGTYDCIDFEERFQVKRITVKPGATLSLQMHHHRAEHWVIVRGTARITCGENVSILTENQSTYIPLGTRHRLENPGKIPLELIEIQSGSYLGEDDIIRYQDDYGR